MANLLSILAGLFAQKEPANASVQDEPIEAEKPAIKLPEIFPEFRHAPSEHFTWEETFVSDTARARGIQNDWRVTEAHRIDEFRDRIMFNCSQLEIVREIIGQSISVNSMYRSWGLNRAVGGSQTSAHPQGLSTDFSPSGNHLAICTKLANELQKRGILWDQIILEEGWLHFSPAQNWDAVNKKPVGQRCQRMTMRGGKYFMGFN